MNSTKCYLPLSTHRKFMIGAVLCVLVSLTPLAQAQTASSWLTSLLNSIPDGGWVKASTNNFSDAWPQGADAVNLDSYSSPSAILRAWSSFAWDSQSQELLLWGGGHANYAGNEMYVWDGITGKWGRGSLPSRLDLVTQLDNNNQLVRQDYFVVDGAAPQSAHTYDNNLYLPVNNMFVTFGGANFNNGSVFQTLPMVNGSPTTAGPWLWDPTKADPTKVGGTTGSGYNTVDVAQGGNMWINRRDQLTGDNLWNTPALNSGSPHNSGTTAYRTENGHDVVYFTADSQQSGWVSLYRYEFGDVRNGGKDVLTQVGKPSYLSIGWDGAGTIDTRRNLYIRSASPTGTRVADLMAWSLDPAGGIKTDIPIVLVNKDGTPFAMNNDFGIDYDSATDRLYLWDGNSLDAGTVWSVALPSGTDSTTWTVTKLTSTTASHPSGSFSTGVFGKWKYVSELGAFIALDENPSLESPVWLYKPLVEAVPEPEKYSMLLAGLAMIILVAGKKMGRANI